MDAGYFSGSVLADRQSRLGCRTPPSAGCSGMPPNLLGSMAPEKSAGPGMSWDPKRALNRLPRRGNGPRLPDAKPPRLSPAVRGPPLAASPRSHQSVRGRVASALCARAGLSAARALGGHGGSRSNRRSRVFPKGRGLRGFGIAGGRQARQGFLSSPSIFQAEDQSEDRDRPSTRLD